MEELENTNPVMDNPGDNPVNPNNMDAENPAPEQQGTDFSQLFSENIAENTPAQKEPTPSVDTVVSQPIQEESVTSLEQTNQVTESPVQETETVNFEKEIEHTTFNNSRNIYTIIK